MPHRIIDNVIKSPSAPERLVPRLGEYLGEKLPVQADGERLAWSPWVVGQLLDNGVENELTRVMIAFFKALAASRQSASAPYAAS